MARGRRPQVRFFESKKGFFAVVDGQRVRLVSCDTDDAPAGPHYCQAVKKWLSLTELAKGKGTSEYTVKAVANSYRIYLAKEGRTSALRIFSQTRTFWEKHGSTPISALKAFEFSSWLETQRHLAANTLRSMCNQVVGALNWAVREDLIPTNPLAGKIRPPAKQGKGREALLPAALMDIMEESADSEAFRRLLRFWRATGCRPEEAAYAEVRHYTTNQGKGRISYAWNATSGFKHKQAKRGVKKDRDIYLTPALCQDIEGAIGGRTEGYIFLTPRRAFWSITNRQNMFRRLMEKPAVVARCESLGINPDDVVPYSYRHTFISTMLDKGMSIKLLADMAGTSVVMIEATYGHTDGDKLHDLYMSFQD